ncbi:gas vesicle protein GvpG [Streptomyces sodiiphilus]|uniref:Gas vesicle protein GvpG n=1 Tax=Streptomyces sodiiphilus TaxID=226217 RepID=A0ABN2P2Z6_9ACTN
MGLLSEIVLLPLAPVRGVAWIADRIADAAEDQLRDPSPVLARLAQLNQELENGEIGTAEFESEEEKLLDLLERRQRAPHRRARPATE